ncbi:MAG: DUF6600 domain-containing protein [Ramlibacter sp.]
MRSRLVSAMHHFLNRRFWRGLSWLAAFLLLLAAALASAQETADPPGRIAHLTERNGGVVFAPQGEEEWIELPRNQPLTTGDRLWTDRGARAELQVGAATLHVGPESHLGFSVLDDDALQVILQQGSVNARVRDLQPGENFEIDTPNLAFRALQQGDYRVDVEANGHTRVVVHSGTASVFGEGGQSVQLAAGQQATFAGRSLAQVQGPAWGQDDFGQWAAARNRAQDQSVSARYVPRGVVGYAQLDQYGTWDAHPQYGSVWYPQVTVQDWAPYRYGHWAYVQPWGWTWVDDAPWGFAPFHYGRWAQIGPRWAWVPGAIPVRPVYSPALVVFLGGGGTSVTISSGYPSVGWYPLAPGEAWWPTYRTSPRYVSSINYHIDLRRQQRDAWEHHYWRQRHYAVTSVRDEDFRRGRPVYRHWRPVQADVVNRWRPGVVPQRPERGWREWGDGRTRLQGTPPSARPGVPVRVGDPDRRDGRDGRDNDRDRRDHREGRGDGRDDGQGFVRGDDGRARQDWRDRDREARDRNDWRDRNDGRDRVLPPAVREQGRAQREQDRLQREAERDARQQIREAEQARRAQDLRSQRERLLREQQESARQQERAALQQRERAERAQEEAGARARQQQQERQRVQQERLQEQRDRVEQFQQRQEQQRERAQQRQSQREAVREERQEQRQQERQERGRGGERGPRS